ncbi:MULTISPECIES: VanZ family protein [unclassified Lactobacillus]|uniref:VanZ family protein n=1 Tax=unclassified Lactobacillus TaxID=2620435 RepID=UPI000EFDADF9|nr:MULTISPECIES: VanZ family protein [unclassified Lactobacillus]RMC40846.1 VanZ family protein [Lactobacillus sp. ESL0237]RMC44601.1 VanZ family protein [Lactobacillus sp. ESL0234]RMC45908.1 VanZ family protein [Lactobacillus sp. ESL0236]RMC46245.1 VanZ family protein [Lactobacillus sp. ESL0230]RMC51298.1 VanZ family protein [Lactobacillus sp. ESL0225]
MIFLGPLYSTLVHYFAMKINHFALIKLTMVALDKTIFYFLLFVIIRLLWLKLFGNLRSIKVEVAIWLFAFYIILLLMLTTFRKTYFPWEIKFNFRRPLSDINLIFLRETWKLIYAKSHIDFIYNFLGNIFCFIPFGFLAPIIFRKKQTFRQIFLLGITLSIAIESLQFLLGTGISDIDDVFFNSCGAAIGYLIYWLFI